MILPILAVLSLFTINDASAATTTDKAAPTTKARGYSNTSRFSATYASANPIAATARSTTSIAIASTAKSTSTTSEYDTSIAIASTAKPTSTTSEYATSSVIASTARSATSSVIASTVKSTATNARYTTDRVIVNNGRYLVKDPAIQDIVGGLTSMTIDIQDSDSAAPTSEVPDQGRRYGYNNPRLSKDAELSLGILLSPGVPILSLLALFFL